MDASTFNKKIAAFAKKKAINTLFYAGPDDAALNKNWLNSIDHLLLSPPCQGKSAPDFKGKMSFTQNLLTSTTTPTKTKSEMIAQLHLDPNGSILGLMPGLTINHIKKQLPLFIETTEAIIKQLPRIQILIILPDDISTDLIHEECQGTDIHFEILHQEIYNAIHACDIVLTGTGPITLDIALLKTPMIIVQDSRNSYPALCNRVAGRKIVKEVPRDPEKIAYQAIHLLTSDTYHEHMLHDFMLMKERLNTTGELIDVGVVIGGACSRARHPREGGHDGCSAYAGITTRDTSLNNLQLRLAIFFSSHRWW